MKKLIFIGLFFVLAGGLVFTGCKKEKEKEPRPSTQSVTDNDEAQSQFEEVFNTSDDAMSSNNLGKYSSNGRLSASYLDSCATVIIIPDTGTTGTIIIDFGDTNCTGQDGRTRRGKIIVWYSGRLRKPGSLVKMWTRDYYVNDNKVEGMRTVQNNTVNLDTIIFDITTTDTLGTGSAKITLTDGKTIIWTATRTRKQVEGVGTLFNIFDNVYEVTGTASGTNRNGISFTVTISKALRRELKCLIFPTPIADRSFIPVSGTIVITPGGLSTRVVDFGTGTCDKVFTVTVDNITYNCTAGQGCQ